MDVRKCARCGHPTLVAVQELDRARSVYGIPLGSERGGGGLSWVCQSCGSGFTHLPPAPVAYLLVPLGLMFGLIGGIVALAGLSALNPWLLALGLGVVAGGSGLVANALWPGFLLWRSPLVPGASAPEIRWRSSELPRRCRCGAPAECVEVTVNRTNGVHTGTERVYACACGKRFTVESGLGVALLFGVGLFLGGIGVVFAQRSADWTELACPGAIVLLGLGGVALGRTGWSRRSVTRCSRGAETGIRGAEPTLRIRPSPPSGPTNPRRIRPLQHFPLPTHPSRFAASAGHERVPGRIPT